MVLRGIIKTLYMLVGSGEWTMSCLPGKKWDDGKNVSLCAALFLRVGQPVRRPISHPPRHPSRYLSRVNALCFNTLRLTWEKWWIFVWFLADYVSLAFLKILINLKCSIFYVRFCVDLCPKNHNWVVTFVRFALPLTSLRVLSLEKA